MVEGTRLESVRCGNVSGGSNPPLSASKNLNRTLGLGSFSLCFSAFIIAYNVVKPPIYGYRRYTLALQLKYSRTGDKGGSPSGSATTARSRALLSFALFRLLIWRVLERRGAADPLVYSSTRHSAIDIVF